MSLKKYLSIIIRKIAELIRPDDIEDIILTDSEYKLLERIFDKKVLIIDYENVAIVNSLVKKGLIECEAHPMIVHVTYIGRAFVVKNRNKHRK